MFVFDAKKKSSESENKKYIKKYRTDALYYSSFRR